VSAAASPTRYVALLRGINVGGNNKVSMAELRTTCESIGCTDVATYIQSGNVVLSSSLSAAALRTELEQAIAEQLAVTPSVMVRTHDQLAEVIAGNPFPTAGAGQIHVGFLSAPLEADVAAALANLSFPPEEVIVRGEELYLYLPNGMGRAKLPPLLLQPRRLRAAITVRNWRTISKLAEMSAQG
jgi:uncharacterized protein (DUF1697 family)